jgi:hypothetical protein
MNVFDYTNNICQSRENIWGEFSEKEYVPFMVNRGLSFHYDTVMFAQEMNQRQDLPKQQQYDFLRLSIEPKKKRWSKWHKQSKDEETLKIAELYGISIRLAQQYLSLLSTEQIDAIMVQTETGGRK